MAFIILVWWIWQPRSAKPMNCTFSITWQHVWKMVVANAHFYQLGFFVLIPQLPIVNKAYHNIDTCNSFVVYVKTLHSACESCHLHEYTDQMVFVRSQWNNCIRPSVSSQSRNRGGSSVIFRSVTAGNRHRGLRFPFVRIIPGEANNGNGLVKPIYCSICSKYGPEINTRGSSL